MSTSSSSITTSAVNGTTRITGLSSGIDVDSIVEKMMTAEKAKKLSKLQQEVQTAEWKQEAYQNIIADIQVFTSTYFNVTSSSSLLNSSNFLQYAASSSDSAFVAATCAGTAAAGNHTIEVAQLATAATLTSSASVSKEVQGSAKPDYDSLTGESFVITLDGTDYTVDLDAVSSFDDLQTAIDTAVGSGKVTVSTNSSGYLEITSADSGVQAITVSATDTNSDSTADNPGLSDLGFGTDAILSNRLDTSDTLATIAEQLSSGFTFNDAGEVELTINGTTKSFAKTVTLATMMSEINKADLGVTMTYSAITGALVMTADDTGAGNTMAVTDTGSSTCNFVSVLLSKSTAGKDAKVMIDDQSFTRSSNTMTINGVTYTANQETTQAVTVNVTQDTDGTYDLISSFVEDYNTLIAGINTALDENSDSDYLPLTEDQKAEMSDEEITAWETKAKVGLLESDSTLRSFLSDLRTAVTNSVSGQTISLNSIGITTSTDYSENGKLSITQETLKAAIASDPEGIMQLFTQEATSKTSSGTSLAGTTVVRSLNASDLSTRYKEEGIAYRFYDIIQKNISTYRDKANNKGILIEKAGTNSSDADSTLSTLIDKYEEQIEDEKDRLDDFEENLYDKYTTLETYISSMNAQLSAISSLTSS